MKFVKACHCIVAAIANGRPHSPTQCDGGGHCSRSASNQKHDLLGRLAYLSATLRRQASAQVPTGQRSSTHTSKASSPLLPARTSDE